MTKNDPRKALGKGLHSLLPSRNSAGSPAGQMEPAIGAVSMLPIEEVSPNPNQPRREFEPTAMFELTQSIQREGLIQPIIVRVVGPKLYQIIAGERRWRAAKAAGLTELPAILRNASDQQVLELAIIENIQREDLNPIELALAFQKMVSELGLSHDQVGERTGKDRVTISNSIRLLQLPEDLQQLIEARKLSPGHARALLKLQDHRLQRETADRAMREGWSVRQMEEFTRPSKIASPAGERTRSEGGAVDPNVKAAVAELERVLGTRVRISEKGKNKGQIEIEYYSDDDLDRIYNQIVGE